MHNNSCVIISATNVKACKEMHSGAWWQWQQNLASEYTFVNTLDQHCCKKWCVLFFIVYHIICYYLKINIYLYIPDG